MFLPEDHPLKYKGIYALVNIREIGLLNLLRQQAVNIRMTIIG